MEEFTTALKISQLIDGGMPSTYDSMHKVLGACFAPVNEDAPQIITMKPSKILSGFVVAAFILSSCKQENAPQLSAASPSQVFVAPVEQRDVPIMREWIGQLDGSENVDIHARASGYIQEIAFKEGTVVKAGVLLLRIDPRPLEAAVAQEEADLAQATAGQWKTELDENRQGQLLEEKITSQQDY